MTIISRTSLRIIIVVLGAAFVGYFIWLVRGGLYPFIIAFLLAYILNPAVSWMESRGMKRLWAILIVYLFLFAAVIIGGIWLVPLLIRELESLGRELPEIIAKGEELIQIFQLKVQNSPLPASLRSALDNSLMTWQQETQLFIAGAVAGILEILSHIIGLVITPVLAFYLLYDWHQLHDIFLRCVPGRCHREIGLLIKDLDKVLSGVIRGQFIIAAIVSALVSAGLTILGVNYALLIGILAGMLDIIPYFGAIIGAVPAVTVALLESPWLALEVAVLFFCIHQVEGTIISPKILGDSVGLHPLTVIFFLFIGEELGGVVGLLLGVPLAAMGKVFLQHLVKALI